MKYIKISLAGEQLPDGATEWVAVLDTETGLMWKKEVEKKRYNWYDLNKPPVKANKNRLCGYDDWRVPTIEELKSLVKPKTRNPSIDPNYFPNAPASYFWSSSPDAAYPDDAWIVDFGYGYNYGYNKGHAGYIRLVRNN